MNSWPRQIYLSFWLSLVFFTVVIAMWLPGYLDTRAEPGYKLTEKSRPSLDDSMIKMASSRFPVRPFEDSDLLPAEPVQQPVRQAIPGQEPSPPGPATLPERTETTPPAETLNSNGPEVTKRAWIVQRAFVYENPQTTARVIGSVERDTRVRWVRTVDKGWEELVLRDGRSVFVQSPALSFVSPQEQESKFDARPDGAQPDVGALPGTVEAFVKTLGGGDALRASTYLAPAAPPLTEDSMGSLATLAGGRPEVDRIEPGRSPQDRVVWLAVEDTRVATFWQWSPGQSRWLLLNWQ